LIIYQYYAVIPRVTELKDVVKRYVCYHVAPTKTIVLLLGSYRLYYDIRHLQLTCLRGTKQTELASFTHSDRTRIRGQLVLLLKLQDQGIPDIEIRKCFCETVGPSS